MQLDDLRENWENYGETNPLWAVHTGRGNIQWDESEFFKTGEEEIDRILSMLHERGAEPTRDRALDFGCGVGRLSQALSHHFDRVDGIDISAPMLAKADEFKRANDDIDDERVQFHLNTDLDLSLFEDRTFSFVLSLIVLQHMKPEFSAKYISEFCRVTAPGGVIAFQIPARRETAMLRLRGAAGRFLRRIRQTVSSNGSAVMEMYGTPQNRVEKILTDNGMRVVAVVPDDYATSWESYTYVAIRD
ncbi:MAG: class I SAM-dependent methyltransferase [Solirubrobacterales bacterium]|nr:class I SAM-dependent methyltransferase [Solirubrobacterales bacterium]